MSSTLSKSNRSGGWLNNLLSAHDYVAPSDYQDAAASAGLHRPDTQAIPQLPTTDSAQAIKSLAC